MSLLMSDDADLNAEVVKYFLNHVQPDLNAWSREHCNKFADVDDAVVLKSDDSEKNLEHWALFQEYVGLMEGRITEFLASKDASVEDFVAKCKEGEEIRKLGLPVADGQFMDLLKLVDDFPGFLVFMRDEYMEQKELAEIAADMADLPPPAPRADHTVMPAAVTYFIRVVQPRLDRFAEAHCNEFYSGDTADGEEHSNEHYDLFRRYTAIFEQSMEEFLQERGITLETFMGRCKAAENERREGSFTSSTSFLDVVGLMDNFEEFVEYMREEAASGLYMM